MIDAAPSPAAALAPALSAVAPTQAPIRDLVSVDSDVAVPLTFASPGGVDVTIPFSALFLPGSGGREPRRPAQAHPTVRRGGGGHVGPSGADPRANPLNAGGHIRARLLPGTPSNPLSALAGADTANRPQALGTAAAREATLLRARASRIDTAAPSGSTQSAVVASAAAPLLTRAALRAVQHASREEARRKVPDWLRVHVSTSSARRPSDEQALTQYAWLGTERTIDMSPGDAAPFAMAIAPSSFPEDAAQRTRSDLLERSGTLGPSTSIAARLSDTSASLASRLTSIHESPADVRALGFSLHNLTHPLGSERARLFAGVGDARPAHRPQVTI